MSKLSHLLRFRGTRFSLTRLGSAMQDAQSAHRRAAPSITSSINSVGVGMAKGASRLKRHTTGTAETIDAIEAIETEERAVGSNDATKLISVEALTPGGDSGVYVVELERRKQNRS